MVGNPSGIGVPPIWKILDLISIISYQPTVSEFRSDAECTKLQNIKSALTSMEHLRDGFKSIYIGIMTEL